MEDFQLNCHKVLKLEADVRVQLIRLLPLIDYHPMIVVEDCKEIIIVVILI